MKTTIKQIYSISLFIFCLNCIAQTPIVPRYGKGFGDIQGAYYKDINNFQDQFIGTWIYTNGTTSLKIVLKKLTMYHDNISSLNYYEDCIIGEYQYTENGVEKVNTLAEFSLNKPTMYDYNLCGSNRLAYYNEPRCNDCTSSEYRLCLSFHEPTRRDVIGLSADFILRRVVENGVEKLIAQLYTTSSGYGFTKDNQPTTLNNYSLPDGYYDLIKQP